MTNQLMKRPEGQEAQLINTEGDNSIFFDVAKFEHAYRVAKMLSQSTLVPEQFRTNVGNCIIALNYAERVGVDPFMIMQKMYIIHGKPGIEAQLQIALFNKSSRFSTLKYKLEGDGDSRQCTAYATENATGETVYGPTVSMALAKAEGWLSKNGSKWKTLPELMLMYRSAAFFIRLYAPETTLGLLTTEELRDMDAKQAAEEQIETGANQGDFIDIEADYQDAMEEDGKKQEEYKEPEF